MIKTQKNDAIKIIKTYERYETTYSQSGWSTKSTRRLTVGHLRPDDGKFAAVGETYVLIQPRLHLGLQFVQRLALDDALCAVAALQPLIRLNLPLPAPQLGGCAGGCHLLVFASRYVALRRTHSKKTERHTLSVNQDPCTQLP